MLEFPFPPMLLERAEQPFADPDWLWQVKWDGVRNLTLVQGGRVRHFSRRLLERTGRFPEFGELGRLLAGREAVLDGEIIVLRGGRPSFSAVLARDLGTGEPDRRKLRLLPATLMLFDLLWLDGRPLFDVPLTRRAELLAELIPESESWAVVESFPGEAGPDLFRAVAAAGLEGVVGKRRESPYRPGVRSRDWQKVKRRLEMLAVVLGYTTPVGRPGGLLLGAYSEGRLRYIGRVGSGVTSEDLLAVRRETRPAPCPLGEEPSLRERFGSDPGPVVWVEPRLTAQVRFTDWTEEGRLRDPVLVRLSSEPPEAAVIP